MKQQKHIPRLRFPEFSEGWDVKPFKEIVKINQGLQISISERLTKKQEGTLFYITNEFLRANSDKKYFIKDAPKSVICNKDDILMTRTGNTGKVVTNVEGAFHNNFFKIAYPKTIVKDYLVNFLNLSSTQNYILRLAGTSTIPDLNHSDFYKIKFTYPKEEEQQKIASFLTAVDSKIELLQKKKQGLEQYKKGVMQQIFAQKLRFKKEDGTNYPDWEEKKLGEIGNVFTGKTPSTTDMSLWNGEIQFITPTDIKEDKKYQLTTQRTVVNNDKINVLPKGSIIYTCIASIGKMTLSVKPCITNQQINSLVPKKDYNNEFVFYSLLKITPKIKSTQSTTTLPIINKTEFSRFKINIPCLKEQAQIANFLSAIDDKIALVNTQLENTQQFKKGLLQQMFV